MPPLLFEARCSACGWNGSARTRASLPDRCPRCAGAIDEPPRLAARRVQSRHYLALIDQVTRELRGRRSSRLT